MPLMSRPSMPAGIVVMAMAITLPITEASYRYAEASAADWDSARACRFAIRERAGKRLLGVVGLEAFAHLH